MKQCVLHIGLHKTGSTFLQNTWEANADLLARRGIFYPVHPRDPMLHHSFARILKLHGVDAAALEEFAAWDARIASRPADETLLLSSETFQSTLYRPHLLAALCDWLLSRFAKVHVIAFVRPQHELVNARYAQSVKMLKLDEDFSVFLSDLLASKSHKRLDFARAFRPLAQQAAKDPERFRLSLLVHTRSGLLPLFMQTAFGLGGLEGLTPPVQSMGNSNQAPGPLTLLLARRVMRALLAEGFSAPFPWSLTFRKFIFAVVDEGGRHGWNDKAFRGFDHATAEAFMDRYRSANAAFVGAFSVSNAVALERNEFAEDGANVRTFESLSAEEFALLDASAARCLDFAPRAALHHE